jgi:hypothetical protein
MTNSPLDRLYQKEWWKIVKKLFKNEEDMIKTSKIYEEIEKSYSNYDEIDLNTVKTFDTNFTWKNITNAIEHQGNIVSINTLRKELKKIYLNKQ